MDRLRIDRWLWYTRFFKTRSLAAQAVQAGHVRVNGQRAKPSREIGVGDELVVAKGPVQFEIAVAGIPPRRESARIAGQCYVESEEARARRAQRQADLRAVSAVSGSPTRGRPDKRTRRLLCSHKGLSE